MFIIFSAVSLLVLSFFWALIFSLVSLRPTIIVVRVDEIETDRNWASWPSVWNFEPPKSAPLDSSRKLTNSSLRHRGMFWTSPGEKSCEGVEKAGFDFVDRSSRPQARFWDWSISLAQFSISSFMSYTGTYFMYRSHLSDRIWHLSSQPNFLVPFSLICQIHEIIS